jgi:DNA-directed RNA polymerase specialized sigma24 family protein
MIAHARECRAVTSGGPQRQRLTGKAIQETEPVDFESYVQCHRAEVFSIATALTEDFSNADAIAQQVFVEANRISRKPFRSLPSRIRLCEVAVRLALGRCSERSLKPGRHLALTLLKRLKQRDCTLLVLREVLGYSLAEISAVCGRGEDKIRCDLFRVRRRAVALKSGEER